MMAATLDDSSDYRTLGDYLDATKTSQRRFANKLGVHQSHVSMLVRGERLPSNKLAREIRRHTGISLDRLTDPNLKKKKKKSK